MSNTYYRKCKYCGRRIRMAEMDNGQWLPFEIDGSGKHECGILSTEPASFSKPTPTLTTNQSSCPGPAPTSTTNQSSYPKYNSPTFDPKNNNIKGKKICIGIIVLLVILILYRWISS